MNQTMHAANDCPNTTQFWDPGMYAASADCSRDFRYQIRTALSMLLP